MKKILFIIPTLQGGGAEKLLADILNNIDYSCYEVHLMYFYESNVYLGTIPQPVKQIIPFLIRSGMLETMKRVILKVCHLEDRIRRKRIRKAADSNYDTIISFLEGMALHFHTFLLDRSKNNISFVHTDISRYKVSLHKHSEYEYAMMDVVAFVSKQAKDSFEKTFPNNKSKHVVLPNFIDTEAVLIRSKELLIQKTVPTLVCVGRLEKVKGFDLLVDIAILLKERIPAFVFRIVGTGIEENALKEKVNHFQLNNFFVFEGFQRNPYPYILNADIMLSTSLAEGFSLVICEAMALGVPVISSKTDGAQSLLGNNAGIIVDRNALQFADAIVLLMNNKDLYQQYATRGKEQSTLYDKSVYMPRLYKLL